MEATIYDYDVTDFELKAIFIKQKNKDEYILTTDERKKLKDLFILFTIREDIVRANDIKKRILKEAKQLESDLKL